MRNHLSGTGTFNRMNETNIWKCIVVGNTLYSISDVHCIEASVFCLFFLMESPKFLRAIGIYNRKEYKFSVCDGEMWQNANFLL